MTPRGGDLIADFRKKLRGKTLTEEIGILYSVCMLFVFPLFFHDYFFDITKTKYLFFTIATLSGFTLMVLSLLIQDHLSSHLEILKPAGAADCFMLVWVAVSIISCIASVDRTASVSGADARWQGLLTVFLYALAYYCMSRCVTVEKIFCYIFLIPGCLNACLGVLNHFGIDPLGFYSRMKTAQIPKFLGTIGNINMFAGYMCLVFAGVFVLFLFEEKLLMRFLWGALLFLATLGHLAGNSDLSYAGLGVTVIVLFAVSWKKKTPMPRLFYGGAIVFAAYWAFHVLQEAFAAYAVSMEGISKELLAHGGLLAAGTVICVAVGLGYRLILTWKERAEKETGAVAAVGADAEKRKTPGCRANLLFHILTVLLLFAAFALLIAVSRLDEIAAFFSFSDSWGDYRGFVWSRLWQIFCDFQPGRILFGSGPGTIKTLLNDYCYEEMKEITGVVYDAAHNEYLQYLVTTGIAGLVSYVGFLGAVFVRGFRTLKKNLSQEKTVCLVFGLAIAAAYAGQAFFSLAQPITTPFLFLFLGWIEKAAKEG